MNGEENYIDDVHAPFPAIRFISHNICLFWCLDVGQRVEREDRVIVLVILNLKVNVFLPLSFLSIVLSFFTSKLMMKYSLHTEKGFKMAFMMNTLAWINSCKIILEK
jgi:hypothetical protein